jgi:glycosyltransferase involved in cell wall biosynthesis
VSPPRLSIIIPTHDRPHLLPRAVKSALEQTMTDLEVIIVDDGSAPPADPGQDPRLRLIRLPVSRGAAAARNVGARAARGQWIAHLDDDDQLLPHFAEVSFDALAHTTLPKPVAVISGLEVVNEQGRVFQTHLPPTLPRGSHFGLETIDPRQSFWSKATLVVERETLMSIGGFDESFTSLLYTDMFLRLNRECSILGIPVLTYRVFMHEGPHLSRDSSRRRASFERLVRKHESFLSAHPSMLATLVLRNAYAMYNLGHRREALVGLCKGMRLHPRHSVVKIASFVWRKLLRGEGP